MSIVRDLIEAPGAVLTTNDVWTELISAALPVESAATVIVDIVAHRPIDGQSKHWFEAAGLGRQQGNLIINAPMRPCVNRFSSGTGLPSLDIALAIRGSFVILQVKGQAGENIQWGGSLRIEAVYDEAGA